MIRVCCRKGCGVVYGEKEPLSDKKTTHGLCQNHLKIYLKEIKAEIEKWHGNHPEHHHGSPAHRRPAHLEPQ